MATSGSRALFFAEAKSFFHCTQSAHATLTDAALNAAWATARLHLDLHALQYNIWPKKRDLYDSITQAASITHVALRLALLSKFSNSGIFGAYDAYFASVYALCHSKMRNF
jgi:hypothetical protein